MFTKFLQIYLLLTTKEAVNKYSCEPFCVQNIVFLIHGLYTAHSTIHYKRFLFAQNVLFVQNFFFCSPTLRCLYKETCSKWLKENSAFKLFSFILFSWIQKTLKLVLKQITLILSIVFSRNDNLSHSEFERFWVKILAWLFRDSFTTRVSKCFFMQDFCLNLSHQQLDSFF